MYFKGLLKLNIKTFAALFLRVLSDLQALVYKQETRIFLFYELVLVNPGNALQECCKP